MYNPCTMAKKKKPADAELESLFLLEDEPVPGFRVDELGLLPLAKVIAGTACGTKGPFTIGVYGDWGHGKTSLLRQAKTLVEEVRPDLVTVWFNAWQYEGEEHPLVPLAATIIKALDDKLADAKSKLAEAAKQALGKISRAMRAVAYGFSAKAKVGVPGFGEIEAGFVAKEMIQRHEKLAAPKDPLIERTLYYNAFELLAKTAVEAAEAQPEEQIKIVVFIDDLDRCLPPQGIRLLESIKLVLAQPGFIFVLAVDRRVLEAYLKKRYEDEFGMADYATSGTQYLDKIVQLPLGMPPHTSRFKEYIERLLARDLFKMEPNKPVKVALEGLLDVLAVGSNYNPRSLVRFINNLIVDRAIWKAMDPAHDVTPDRLGLCAVSRILRQHLGEVDYRDLADDPTLCELAVQGPGSGFSLLEDTFEDKELPFEKERSERILTHLFQTRHIRRLLETHAGKRWLVDHNQRSTVNEFLAERPSVPDSAQPSPTLDEDFIAGLRRLLEEGRRDQLARRLDELTPSQVADLLEVLSTDDKVALFSLLEAHDATDVLVETDAETREDIIESVRPEKLRRTLAELERDEAESGAGTGTDQPEPKPRPPHGL